MIMRMNVSNITFHGLIGLEKTICYVHFVWGGGGEGGDKLHFFNALYPMSPYSSPKLKEHKQFITRHSCNLLLRVRYIHPWAKSTKIDSKGITMSIFQRGLSCCQSGLWIYIFFVLSCILQEFSYSIVIDYLYKRVVLNFASNNLCPHCPKTHSIVIGLQKVVLNLIPISESHNTQLRQHRPYGAAAKVHIQLVAISFCMSDLLLAWWILGFHSKPLWILRFHNDLLRA
jgi:hypothetical protein